MSAVFIGLAAVVIYVIGIFMGLWIGRGKSVARIDALESQLKLSHVQFDRLDSLYTKELRK